MGDSINLKEYVDMFKRRKGIIILVMLVCLVMGAYKTYRNYISYKPTYSSTVTVRINTTTKVTRKGQQYFINTNLESLKHPRNVTKHNHKE